MARERVRFDCLDGLRGWAALSVVLFHATSESFGPAMPVLGDALVRVLQRWWVRGQGILRALRVRAVPSVRGGWRCRWSPPSGGGRYARLVVPIGLISAIGYVMLSFGLFHNVQAGTVLDSAWLADQSGSFRRVCSIFSGSRCSTRSPRRIRPRPTIHSSGRCNTSSSAASSCCRVWRCSAVIRPSAARCWVWASYSRWRSIRSTRYFSRARCWPRPICRRWRRSLNAGAIWSG